MDETLKGKTVVVTGASSGIGRATARLLAQEGCKVVLAARGADKLKALAKEIGPSALAIPTDVAVPEEVNRMVLQATKHFGGIDALLANAGIFIPGDFSRGNPDDWSRTLAVNVDGVFRCIYAVLPGMKARGTGDIIVTTSISGLIDIQTEPVYSASKHAVQGFVHTLRRQVAASGIRVGAISPGIVLNEIWGITDEAEIARRVEDHSGIRSEDVARSILFMLSQPRHVTIRDLVILPQNQDI
ncbi:MAG TPA: SDR family oxidoreductase [Spirochaetia bacterium]|nr:SDR family oxidoreductase [Spirochaetia bacterium]